MGLFVQDARQTTDAKRLLFRTIGIIGRHMVGDHLLRLFADFREPLLGGFSARFTPLLPLLLQSRELVLG
ncbi:MAG: hypothetical protein QM831_44755 [Kofleriaceae bacterium]